VKNVIKEKGLMCSGEVMDALNDCVHECLAKAAERAKENGRKTVQAKDV
jgi:histone H3/H4